VFAEAQLRSLRYYHHFHYHEYKAGVNFKAHPNVVLTLAAGDYDTYREGGNFIRHKTMLSLDYGHKLYFNTPFGFYVLNNATVQNLDLQVLDIEIDFAIA
jgi:hypothetical protein